MKFTAALEISPSELRTIIKEQLERNGIQGIEEKDIQFVVQKVEFGNQRDSWEAHEFTKVVVNNIKVGHEE